MQSARQLRVVMAGGGTAGHLYPGVAVARALLGLDPSAQITFAGTRRGLETRLVPREGFELDLIRSTGLKGKSPAALLRGLATLPLSALDAWRVISKRSPRLVIGLGGYSSGPVVAAAALRGIPTMLLEQNALPGLTNRMLARVVRAAAVTYPESLPYFGAVGFVSGNPVRPEFVEARDERANAGGASGRVRVLVFGGSQGAHAINTALAEAAPEIARLSDRLHLTHQTGERDLEPVRAAYRAAGLDQTVVRVESFLHEMSGEMTRADLVVCRAGASTLAELAAIGRAALLIPLPSAADDHQRRNAEVLRAVGAADVLDQVGMTGSSLVQRIGDLAADGERLARMAEAMHGFARPDAAEVIARRALTVVAPA